MQRSSWIGRAGLLALALSVLAASCQAPEQARTAETELAGPDIAGGAWRLVSFESRAAESLTATDLTQATVEFRADGRADLQLGINRGSSTWKLGGWNEIELGVLALTRAAGPPDPLRDRFTQDWTSLRGLELEEGRLALSLPDQAGRYELERAPAQPK